MICTWDMRCCLKVRIMFARTEERFGFGRVRYGVGMYSRIVQRS